MAEGGEAASGTSSATKRLAEGIAPGVDIFKFWQGIVEAVLRGFVMGMAVCLIIAGSLAEGDTEDIQTPNNTQLKFVHPAHTKAAAGWLIFMGVMTLLYEAVALLQRLVNVKIINKYHTVFILVDVIVHGVLAAGVFAGATAMASYVPDYKSLVDDILTLDPDDSRRQLWLPVVKRVVSSTEASTVFGYFYLIPVIAVAVFVGVGGLLLKWSPTRADYTTIPGSGEGEGSGGGDGEGGEGDTGDSEGGGGGDDEGGNGGGGDGEDGGRASSE